VAIKIGDRIVALLESQVSIDVSGSIREKRQLRLGHIRPPGVMGAFCGEDRTMSLIAVPLSGRHI
jgi:hypothetical protein